MISALSSGSVGKYEFLTGEDVRKSCYDNFKKKNNRQRYKINSQG